MYTDDPTVPTKTQVRVSTKSVKGGQSMEMKLLPRGGQALWLTPLK
ncbi:hypothetical protein [Spirosoma telluris]